MLIVIAEPEEIELVKKFGFDKEPIIITGVGAINVISALKNIPKNEQILNIGYCGSNFIEKGKKVSVTQVKTLHNIAKFDERNVYCKQLSGNPYFFDEYAKCYTSNDFIIETNIQEPCIFDMELAYICAMFDNVYSIKVVSDNLSYEEYKKR